jgi:hypothetical protein
MGGAGPTCNQGLLRSSGRASTSEGKPAQKDNLSGRVDDKLVERSKSYKLHII